MGIMVYSLYWVMQDFVHQPYHPSSFNPKDLNPKVLCNHPRVLRVL